MQELLKSEDPCPAETTVFAARWWSGRRGVSTITARVDLDERTVEYLAGSGPVFGDRFERCAALWAAT